MHELPTLLGAHGLALNSTLTDMLHEHFSHRTERRGCGFTQATRHLAVLVNRPRAESADVIARLFPDWAGPRSHEDAETLQRALRALIPLLEREESRTLAAIMADLVLPIPEASTPQELPPYFGELKVGTCPLAEKYFLEISEGFVRRKGRVNILVSERGEPLLVEKLNLGDNHSCISLTELVMNGVRLPAGCLFAVQREEGVELRPARTLPGDVIPIQRCTGFRFLRLTTLAVSPQHRARAFTSHFQSQVSAGLYAPDQVTIEQVRRVAEAQL
ncbi:MAG TPA: hypothetical protein VFZ61_09570 [Polyangiales bacterium]